MGVEQGAFRLLRFEDAGGAKMLDAVAQGFIDLLAKLGLLLVMV